MHGRHASDMSSLHPDPFTSTPMLRIRTLGVSEIHVGDKLVRPDHSATFLLLLLTALRAPRPVSRLELAELLWAGVPGGMRSHRLRSLLHRARQAGAPLECTETTVRLGERPVVDFRELTSLPRSLEDVRRVAPIIGAILPGIPATQGTPIAARLDDERDVIRATAIRWVSAALGIAKGSRDWLLVEELARAGRVVDPFNEEAWLSLAEAQCLTASKLRALRTLDDYIAEVGERDQRITLPAELLRRRVAERGGAMPVGSDDVEASGDAARLTMSIVDAAGEGRGGALVVWGPEGSGKTRLLHSIQRARRRGMRVVSFSGEEAASRGARELALALTARLLNEPGAAGCDPACYAALRVAVGGDDGDAELAAEELVGPFLELLAALADDAATVILVDDMPRGELETQRFWSEALRRSRGQRVVWVFAMRASDETELANLPDVDVLKRHAMQPAARLVTASG